MKHVGGHVVSVRLQDWPSDFAHYSDTDLHGMFVQDLIQAHDRECQRGDRRHVRRSRATRFFAFNIASASIRQSLGI